MPHTPFCDRFAVTHPILNVGFGPSAGPELAAAVSNAGGLGVLGGTGLPAALVRERIARTRALTDRPFALNVIIAPKIVVSAPQSETIGAALAEGVAAIVLFWGDPRPYVAAAHDAGTKLIVQVGSVDEARDAATAGVDAIIAQGYEAGGHVKAAVSLATNLPAIVDAVAPLPVLAAGGIADGRGLAAALLLGAQGVSMGTRFVASEECWTRREYKERVVLGTAEDTVYAADLFHLNWPDAPHRVLRNRVVAEWEAAGKPPPGQKPNEATPIGTTRRLDGATVDVPRYLAAMPTAAFNGDIDLAGLWAGESVSLIHDIRPAADIVRDIARDADRILTQNSAQR